MSPLYSNGGGQPCGKGTYSLREVIRRGIERAIYSGEGEGGGLETRLLDKPYGSFTERDQGHTDRSRSVFQNHGKLSGRQSGSFRETTVLLTFRTQV